MMSKRYGQIRAWLAAAITAMATSAGDALASRASHPAVPPDPRALYGPGIDFDVYRKGEKVGFHRVRFVGNSNDVTVLSDFRLRIDVLFIPVFRYAYKSEGRWRHGKLERLSVTVDDDGKRSALDATRIGDRIRVDHTDVGYVADMPLFPTNHWNAGVLAQKRVLNTLTGRINAVRIEAVKREPVTTERGEVPATRYAYSGDLETEVWYDDAGRWVKMRFAGRDGSTIEYVCSRCQGGRSGQAAK